MLAWTRPYVNHHNGTAMSLTTTDVSVQSGL
jgi:hypothetical protein